MSRRLAYALISTLGIIILVVTQLAVAHPHLRHATGTLSIEILDDNNVLIPARLTFRPVGETPKLSSSCPSSISPPGAPGRPASRSTPTRSRS